MAQAKAETVGKKQQQLRGYLVLYNDNHESSLYLLRTELPEALLLRLLKYAANNRTVGETQLVMRVSGQLHADAGKWEPTTISYFVEARLFTSDKTGCFWCLLSKEEARQLHREYMEDPRYAIVPEPGKSNYFKNVVDEFKHQLESRKWST